MDIGTLLLGFVGGAICVVVLEIMGLYRLLEPLRAPISFLLGLGGDA